MRILIVEDSALVRKMYGLAFPPRQHQLILAESGKAALAVLDASGDGFDLILLDLRMPDMNGVEFLAELARRRIAIPVILTTGEAPNSPLVAEAQAYRPAAVAYKPWRPDELRELASQVHTQEAR